MGFILTLTSFSHLICLIIFFITGSKATKFRAHLKKKQEKGYKEGGQRSWVQVLCNGGVPTQLALLYLLDVGCGEHPIDFDKNYRSSWLSIGILGRLIYYSIYHLLYQIKYKFVFLIECRSNRRRTLLHYSGFCLLQWRYMGIRIWYGFW